MNKLKTCFIYCLAYSLLFVIHALTKEAYHRFCNSNLLYMFIFGESPMCRSMTFILDKLEFVVQANIKQCVNIINMVTMASKAL
jgi:hypothetical protein